MDEGYLMADSSTADGTCVIDINTRLLRYKHNMLEQVPKTKLNMHN